MAISRDKKGNWEADKKRSGGSTLLHILSPISNLDRLKKGGKVRAKKRMKARA